MAEYLETYLIHDNGSRPFKVVINKLNDNDYSNIQVYKVIKDGNDDDNEFQYETTPILTFQSKFIFIGKSPLNQMTKFCVCGGYGSKFDGGYGSKFDGNSILLHLNDNTYVHIGTNIFSFETYEKITLY